MGGGSSACRDNYQNKSDDQIMKFMLPLYYTTESVTKSDMDVARSSWNLITSDTSPLYLDKVGTGSMSQPSCISWFYTTFYHRLFDIHPSCKPLFNRGIVGQGSFLVKMISLTLNQLRNPETFKQTMESLAERHCEWGVRGGEYGIVGDVLFYSLHFVLGAETFNERVQQAWWKVYSAMLTHILPICIRHERNGSTKSARKPAVYGQSVTCCVSETTLAAASTSRASIDRVMSLKDADTERCI